MIVEMRAMQVVSIMFPAIIPIIPSLFTWAVELRHDLPIVVKALGVFPILEQARAHHEQGGGSECKKDLFFLMI